MDPIIQAEANELIARVYGLKTCSSRPDPLFPARPTFYAQAQINANSNLNSTDKIGLVLSRQRGASIVIVRKLQYRVTVWTHLKVFEHEGTSFSNGLKFEVYKGIRMKIKHTISKELY